MAGTSNPIFPQSMVNAVAQIANSDAQALKTLVNGGTNGTKIESITVTSTDTVARDIIVWATISAVSYQLARIQIPVSSGNTNSAPSVDLLKQSQWASLAYDAFGNKYLYVANGTTISISAPVSVTSGTTIQAFAQGGNY